MVALARDQGVELPSQDPGVLGRMMVADDAADLESYLDRFRLTISVLQTAEALERVAYELAEDLAQEGALYVEVRFCPLLNTRGGLTSVQAVEAASRGLQRAQRALGIRWGLIVCALRSLPHDRALEMAEVALETRPRGVVGFDLAGAEAGFPPAEFLEAFRLVAEGNLPVTIHAGEGWGPDSIRQAIHRCGARRIGHGTRLREDPGLQAYVRDFGIHLEVCPTSNVQTRVVPDLAEHPVGAYLTAGLSLSINTDNRLVSGVTLVDEYAAIAEAQGWGRDEVRIVARNAFQAAFLPLPEKTALLARVDQELDAVLG
jgi:adenosine deaminase